MGIARDHNGYSANIEGYLVVSGMRFRLAKTNGVTFTLAEDCELAPGTEADLLIVVDGDKQSKRVELPDGVHLGGRVVFYKNIAPF